MKAMLSLSLLILSALICVGDSLALASTSVTGTVLETMDASGYTYLRLKTNDGEIWAAVVAVEVKKGAEVTLINPTVMSDFKSKTLNKTFPTILFGALATTEEAILPPGHAPVMPAAPANIADSTVARASGADAKSVEEIITQSAQLNNKSVLVRGKVVKFNSAIMGKNWIHLRDGTGSEVGKTNDILVTTEDETNVGDIVVVKGTVHTDKDFGSGYTYKVIIEEATLQK